MLNPEKKCGKCGDIKPPNEFSRDRDKKDGLQAKCKSCNKRYAQSKNGKLASRYYNQSEKGRQARNRYKKTAKGRMAQKRINDLRVLSDKDKEDRKSYNRSEEGKNASKKYNASKKGRRSKKRNDAVRRTNRANGGGSYTTTEWYALCEFYNFHCLMCNQEFLFAQLTVDHVKAVSKAGTSFIWNLQPLCLSCNSSKGNKEIDYRKTLPDWINRDGSVWQQDKLF